MAVKVIKVIKVDMKGMKGTKEERRSITEADMHRREEAGSEELRDVSGRIVRGIITSREEDMSRKSTITNTYAKFKRLNRMSYMKNKDTQRNLTKSH